RNRKSDRYDAIGRDDVGTPERTPGGGTAANRGRRDLSRAEASSTGRWRQRFHSRIHGRGYREPEKLEALFRDELDQVDNAARIAPLVVVPGNDFQEIATGNLR